MKCFIDFCLQNGETRVWRTYVGGARLNEWHGRKAEQVFFPGGLGGQHDAGRQCGQRRSG